MKFDKLPDPLPATVAELNELAATVTAEIRVFQARAAANDEFSAEETERFEYLLDSRDKVVTERDSIAAADQAQTENLNALLDRANAATEKPEPEPAADTATDNEAAPADGDGGVAAEVVAEAEAATAAAAAESETVTAAAGSGRQVEFAGAVRNSEIPAGTPGGETPKGWDMLQSAPKYAEFGTKKVGFAEIAQSIASVSAGSVSGRQRTGTSPDGNYATQA
ncbi:major capsid protein, partial [Mycobacteroides abscessus]|nr:major capsid protein [Mycobacteroides abscessus]